MFLFQKVIFRQARSVPYFSAITEHVFNEGETKGKKDTAINLLKMGFDVKIINQATGFSKK